jgi:phosphoribosyl 1,2-cyclic phosphodiesterase
MSFEIKIWGCRGSIPVATPENIRFGGSTACVELSINGQTVIIDAGSGIRELGTQILARGTNQAHLLLSHGHYDHLMGLPFFSPVYDRGMKLDIWSGHTGGNPCTRDIIAGFMKEPYLPVTIDLMCANMSFHDIKAGSVLDLGHGITATSAPTHHPGGCLAWRVDCEGRGFVYLSDHEHGNAAVDVNLVKFARGADVMVYDAMYTDEEYEKRKGFGHSTWRQACKVAKAAEVKELLLFHHAPERTDRALESIEAQAHKLFTGASASRDGHIIKLD